MQIEYGFQSEYSGFTRWFTLPADADEDQVTAHIRERLADDVRDSASIEWCGGDESNGSYMVSMTGLCDALNAHERKCDDCMHDNCPNMMYVTYRQLESA